MGELRKMMIGYPQNNFWLRGLKTPLDITYLLLTKTSPLIIKFFKKCHIYSQHPIQFHNISRHLNIDGSEEEISLDLVVE
ncbi:hypothetical protein [Nostoc sp. PCC 7524]|uniref:hypothetical protein n=1 Tax=Nostoc sp. (strain ATCC 29411 / PCC 7524) TaxID=28072 RepID=UPI0005A0D31D|nr:hypothetical protein [Nostoc sp. PCC 7524]